MIDNVELLGPELLSEVGQLVVESGHRVAGKKPGAPLRGRVDSFVVETDVHYAVPMVKAGQGRFPELRAASFDRGFHSPDNRQRLDAMLDCAALLKKGRLGQADRERESEPEFMAMRRRHPAVESAINGLEHRGLDRVRTHGAEGFARTVALAVLAANLHRLGRLRPRFRIIPLRRLPHSAPQQPKNEGFLADMKLPTASQTLSNPTHL